MENSAKIEVMEKNQSHEELQSLLKAGCQHESDRSSIISQLDRLCRSKTGLEVIYKHIGEVIDSGLFNGTAWEAPQTLVPTLVKGTLCSGYPMITYETVSELRVLAVAKDKYKMDGFDSEDANRFLREVIISSIDLAFGSSTELTRIQLTKQENKRIRLLFDFLLRHIEIAELKELLLEEVRVHSAQRRIQTHKLEEMIGLIRDHMTLDREDPFEQQLIYFIDALYHPTIHARTHLDPEDYRAFLKNSSKRTRLEEAQIMGGKMKQTGLVSGHQVVLLKSLEAGHQDILGEALALNSHGRAELERHETFVLEIIQQYVHDEQRQVVYGLSRLLNRNLLSRKAVWNALHKLFKVSIHPTIAGHLVKSIAKSSDLSAEQILSGAVIQLLGQPLGVGQGMNPTCQSARGLSMWSQHSPEKLLNMIMTTAAANELRMRYEGEIISSVTNLGERSIDMDMDAVSVVLVPHLDSIYHQMMNRAMMKHPLDDPHVSVNPAFYGHWIQTGFVSCYKPLTHAIEDYDGFVRLFYAAFHPQYNNDYKLVYPIPLGIFITSAQGEMLGFHAVSLLRVVKDPQGEWRAYFFNPNNEGRQDWGQGIKPSVSGNGERHGESSLPVHEFVSRVYAFHYNALESEQYVDRINSEIVENIEQLARTSWGKKYIWN